MKDSRIEIWKKISQDMENFESLKDYIRGNIYSISLREGEGLLTYCANRTTKKNFTLELNSKDLRSAPLTILSSGYYEPSIEKVIFTLFEKSKVFLDIGANVGFYTCSAVTLNHQIKVFAFEPNLIIAEKLESNVKRNNYDKNVKIVRKGISNTASTARFFIPPTSGSSAGSLIELHPEEGESEMQEIELISIDTLEEIKSSKIDLIKIDIEGNELAALQGAIKTIEKDKPTIIVELLRKWMKPFGHQPQEVVEILNKLGYECWALSDFEMRKIESIDEKTVETNFLFVHSNQIVDVVSEQA